MADAVARAEVHGFACEFRRRADITCRRSTKPPQAGISLQRGSWGCWPNIDVGIDDDARYRIGFCEDMARANIARSAQAGPGIAFAHVAMILPSKCPDDPPGRPWATTFTDLLQRALGDTTAQAHPRLEGGHRSCIVPELNQ